MKIAKDILVVSEREPFMVNSLCKGIEEVGFTTERIQPHITDFMQKENVFIIFIYIDDFTNNLVQFLVFLRGRAEDESLNHIYLLGDEIDTNNASKILGKENIRNTFVRPLNINKIKEDITSLINKAKEDYERPHILLVDTSVDKLYNMARILKDKFNVHFATSAFNAITFLVNQGADLVISSYDLPIVSGIDLYLMMRSEESIPNVPFILAFSSEEEIIGNQDLFRAQVDGYFLKGEKFKTVLETINKCLERGK